MTSLYEKLQDDTDEGPRLPAGTGSDPPPLNLFEKEATEVRNHRVNWQSYVQ